MPVSTTGKISLLDMVTELQITPVSNIKFSDFIIGGKYNLTTGNAGSGEVIPSTTNNMKLSSYRGLRKVLPPSILKSFESASLSNNSKKYTLSNYFTGNSLIHSIILNPYSNASIFNDELWIYGSYRNTSYNVTVKAENTSSSVQQNANVSESKRPNDVLNFTSLGTLYRAGTWTPYYQNNEWGHVWYLSHKDYTDSICRIYFSNYNRATYSEVWYDFMIWIDGEADALWFWFGDYYTNLNDEFTTNSNENKFVFKVYGNNKGINYIGKNSNFISATNNELAQNNWHSIKIVFGWDSYYSIRLNGTIAHSGYVPGGLPSTVYWGFGSRTGGLAAHLQVRNLIVTQMY